jgi:glycosyltransferase involved in cell wall biosynthesis
VKISVITVSFNSADTIRACVSSVYNQSWHEIEHILIDGGSDDNTVSLAQSIPNRLTYIKSEPDSGIYDAINKGIMQAGGDIIGILNSDDVYADENSVQKIVHAFQDHNPDCVYGNLIFTNAKGRTVRVWKSQPFISGLFQKSWTPAHPTFYVRRDIYARYGLYKTTYKIAADVELMLRFLEIHRVSSHFMDEVLVNMRYGGISTRGLKSTITITKEMRRAFHENGLNLNLIRYIFHKIYKIRELIFKS